MKKILSFSAILMLAFFSAVSSPPFKTSLTLTVRDELGNTVEGAEVKLFENKDSYTKETNAVMAGVTDAKGIVKFKELKPIAYYIIVRKGDKDNAGGGEQIQKLEEGKFNKSTVVIQ